MKNVASASVDMGYSYSEIMGVVAQGGYDVRGSNYGSYLEAWMFAVFCCLISGLENTLIPETKSLAPENSPF